MASKNTKKQGVSWELIGIVAIVAALVVGGLYIMAESFSNPTVTQELETPSIVAQDPTIGLGGADMVGVGDDGRPFLGQADAPVTLYEFADFQCPHCRDFSLFQSKDIKRDLIASGKAKLVWVAFPFMGSGGSEDESVNAQMAGQCAAKQGKFWTMHDWLFTNQDTISNRGRFAKAKLADMAEQAGLDLAAFETCMADPATEAFVQADKDFGISKSVGSTPSFLIEGNDKLFEGSAPEVLTELTTAIQTAAGAN